MSTSKLQRPEIEAILRSAVEVLESAAITLRMCLASLDDTVGTRPASGSGSAKDDELLTVTEAAARMRVPTSWLYAATKRNRFPCVRFGKYVRIRSLDVEQWIESGGRAPLADFDE